MATFANAATGYFIAPGAPVFQSRGRRALGMLGDLGAAVLLVWTLPLAFAIVVAMIRGVVSVFTG